MPCVTLIQHRLILGVFVATWVYELIFLGICGCSSADIVLHVSLCLRRGSISIGSVVDIPVWTYGKTSEQRLPSMKKLSTAAPAGSDGAVGMDRTYRCVLAPAVIKAIITPSPISLVTAGLLPAADVFS